MRRDLQKKRKINWTKLKRNIVGDRLGINRNQEPEQEARHPEARAARNEELEVDLEMKQNVREMKT